VANPTTAPFADMDADGLADTDALGQFIDDQNQVLAVPAPFELPEGDSQVPWGFRDAEGRPLIDDGGDLIYEYVDLDKTVFAALSRDALQLFDKVMRLFPGHKGAQAYRDLAGEIVRRHARVAA